MPSGFLTLLTDDDSDRLVNAGGIKRVTTALKRTVSESGRIIPTGLLWRTGAKQETAEFVEEREKLLGAPALFDASFKSP